MSWIFLGAGEASSNSCQIRPLNVVPIYAGLSGEQNEEGRASHQRSDCRRVSFKPSKRIQPKERGVRYGEFDLVKRRCSSKHGQLGIS